MQRGHGSTLLLVGARRFLLPFFKSAQQPSTQYALSLSLMMATYHDDDVVKNTRIQIQT